MPEHSMLAELLRKKSMVLKAQDNAQRDNHEVNFTAAAKEVDRQLHQIGSEQNGNPISGEGLTKSGSSD